MSSHNAIFVLSISITYAINCRTWVGRGPMELFSSYDMNKLDWKGCDIVLEGTEKFIDGLKSKT